MDWNRHAGGRKVPIIITAHMANTNANSIALHGASAGAMISDAGRDHSEPRHVHAAHVHIGSEPQTTMREKL